MIENLYRPKEGNFKANDKNLVRRILIVKNHSKIIEKIRCFKAYQDQMVEFKSKLQESCETKTCR